MGANVNHYMAHGGTNFGFTSGANWDGDKYVACPTSYDYDAPISEAGDLTKKYFDIKEIISKFLVIPAIDVNATVPKGAYGNVKMKPLSSIFIEKQSLEHRASNVITKSVMSKYPLTFEALGQASGFVLYQTKIEELFRDPAKLVVTGIRDRGYVLHCCYQLKALDDSNFIKFRNMIFFVIQVCVC